MAAPRLAHLDGLRGVAALIVALSLCAEFIVPPLAMGPEISPGRILAFDFNMADAGFVVLFALSGYLIAHNFRGANPWRDFILKRGLRLYPTFLVAGGLALCLLPLSPHYHPTLRQFVKSFATMHPLTASPEFDHSHWLLVVLMVFYALSLGAAILNLHARRSFAIGAAFFLLAVCGGLTVIGGLYHRHFPILVLLCLAVAYFGSFVRQHQDGTDSGFVAITAGFWSGILLITTFAWSPHWGLGEQWLGKATAFALAAALFLYGVLRQRITARPLIRLGDISYAGFFFLPLLLSTVNPYVSQTEWIPRLATALAALGVTYVLAAITFRFVGRPIAERGRRLIGEGVAGSPITPSQVDRT